MTQPIPDPIPATASSRQVVVHGVQWQNVLEFTHLFRGFRLAINPAKLGIALLAILVIYIAGRIFDAAWGGQVYVDEIQIYATEKPAAYRALRSQRNDSNRQELLGMLYSVKYYDGTLTDARVNELKTQPTAAYRALKKAYELQFAQDLDTARQSRQAMENIGNVSLSRAAEDGGGSKSQAEIEQDRRARAADQLLANITRAHDAAGRGIFESFMKFEIAQFDNLVENTLGFLRVAPMHNPGDSFAIGDARDSALSAGLFARDSSRWWRSDTLTGCLANMVITGPGWLLHGTAPMQWRPDDANTWGGWFTMLGYRALYLVSLLAWGVIALLAAALAGASISRLSALELAGVERPPLADVFHFAGTRLWVFIKAPITPFLILLVVGIALAAGGLLGAIPFIGEIILGVLFILYLAVGFVLMLLSLGIIGGFNLLYPTIAVEGADAFDAMSRSFAYVYARPWRVLLYSLVSLLYGVLTFLFVSFAVYLILLITHTFVGWGTSLMGYNHGWYSGIAKLDTLWPTPHFGQLITPINWYAMSWSEYLGALFLHFWVFLLIAGVGAYVISYYFSSHTIMYLLLRRSVDGQGIREIYQEETTASSSLARPQPPTQPSAANVPASSPAPAAP